MAILQLAFAIVLTVGGSSYPFTVLEKTIWRKQVYSLLSLNATVYTGQGAWSSEGQRKEAIGGLGEKTKI